MCNFLSHNSNLCSWTCSFLKTVLLLKIMWMWLTSGRLPVEIVCKISSLTFRQNLNGEIVVLYIPHPSRMGTQTHYKQNSQSISVELYLVVVLKSTVHFSGKLSFYFRELWSVEWASVCWTTQTAVLLLKVCQIIS